MSAFFALPRLPHNVPPVESLSEHRLDDGLTTDIQRLRFAVQILQHGRGESTLTRWAVGLTTVN